MNIWKNDPLAKKHEVEIVRQERHPFTLYFEDDVFNRPNLDIKVAAWRNKKTGKPFPAEDLVPNRIGVPVKADNFGAIYCSPISWGQYTIMTSAVRRRSLLPSERFYCLTICGVVTTTDEHMVLSLRSKKVSIYKNMWQVSAAGIVDLELAEKSSLVIPQFYKELEEELNVLPSNIITMEQLGLCKHMARNSALLEVCMSVRVNLSSKKLLEGAKDAVDAWEGEIHTFPIKTVRDMLCLESEEKFTPGGAATLLLAFQR